MDRAASPLSGLRLEAPQRWKLALRLDDPLHALDAKRPNQLILEVSDADAEAEARRRASVSRATLSLWPSTMMTTPGRVAAPTGPEL